MPDGADLGVKIVNFSTSKFLLRHLARGVVVIRLSDRQAIDGSDDSSGAFRPTVLRATPVSFRSR